MRRHQIAASIVLASASTLALAQGQDSTETYTYDELGRLIKVEIANGSQDGEERVYAYDAAGNRTQVNSSGANGSGQSSTLPSECALGAADWTGSLDTALAWPRVYVSSACNEDLTISYTITQVSGQGTWTDMGFGGSTGTDPVLEAGPPKNEFYKLMYIQPDAGSVPSGTQLELQMNWQVDNFTGAGTTDQSSVLINGTGITLPPSGCTLEAIHDYSTPDENTAYVRAQKVGTCSSDVTMGYTIERVSGPGGYSDFGFWLGDNVISTSDTDVTVRVGGCGEYCLPEGETLTLRVNWTVTSGNATISPTYSTIIFRDTH